MKVAVITPDNFPPDIRIEREVRTLLASGYELCIYASDKTPVSKRVSNYLRAKVVYLNYKIIKGFSFMDWRELLSVLGEFNPDAVHIHNPQIFVQGYLAARKLKAKVVFDNHELWTVFSLFSKVSYPLRLPLLLIYFVLELVAAKVSDVVITVSEDMKDTLHRVFRVNKKKIFAVENFEEVSLLSSLESNLNKPSLTSVGNDKFVVCYMGGTEEHRGLRYLLESLKYIESSVLDKILILIVGDMSENLRETISRLPKNLSSKVVVTGFLPFNSALAFLKKADIAVIPYEKNAYTMYALPNKASIYLYFRKPVLATELRTLKRYFGNAMYFVPEPHPRKFAEGIVKLYYDKQLRESLATKGYNLIVRRNNWEYTSQKLKKIYQMFEISINKNKTFLHDLHVR